MCSHNRSHFSSQTASHQQPEYSSTFCQSAPHVPRELLFHMLVSFSPCGCTSLIGCYYFTNQPYPLSFQSQQTNNFNIPLLPPKPIYASFSLDYPAHTRSARARMACTLRALGLLLAESALTMGRGRLFGALTVFFFLRKWP